jgi:hypothetical protein
MLRPPDPDARRAALADGPVSQNSSHTENLSLENADFQARKFARAQRNHNSTTIELSNLPAEISRVTPTTPAGAHLQRRYRVPAGIADLVAQLAGLGLEEARQ